MKKLVILGGGYGSMKIMQQLSAKDLPEDYEIVLVDKLPYHCIKTEYYALAAGTESDHDIRVPFPKHVRRHFGHVQHIDVESRTITLSGDQHDPETLSYDKLVIGLGAEDKYHGVPGASEHTHSIQSMESTRKTYEAISNLPPRATVSVVGAGLSGVELAAELRESRHDLTIHLFDRGETILPMFPLRLSTYVTSWFEKHDVDIVSNSNITKVSDGALYNHDERVQSDAVIWTAGVQPVEVVRNMEVEQDRKGHIILTKHHHIPNHPDVFVVGDCASLPYAPSGQLAEKQGEQIVMILKKQWAGEPLPDTMPEMKLKGTLGSLGKKKGFGVMGDKASVKGRVARILKSGVLWMYKYHSGV
ncbi:NAD(P)/FAD-dependent oxidoreductase [Geomicrobium sp. JCM 19039]|uniref:NAD(P)/FAD-dependent oxidoreductase n=1 Tax=Geomicrobium sp. JCM 19039 TaxID=1460636 RepID=UPI00045F211B|nr:NAD(P)/FAD-dependent oxidoreductase [Geomicrobium sp. JCM 19039]GAK13719.1 NADH dehydrogenase [Geomicrobium sp. JCM 19039]